MCLSGSIVLRVSNDFQCDFVCCGIKTTSTERGKKNNQWISTAETLKKAHLRRPTARVLGVGNFLFRMNRFFFSSFMHLIRILWYNTKVKFFRFSVNSIFRYQTFNNSATFVTSNIQQQKVYSLHYNGKWIEFWVKVGSKLTSTLFYATWTLQSKVNLD